MQPDLIGKTLLVLRDTGVLVDRKVARSWDLETIARVESILTQHIAPGYEGTLSVTWSEPDDTDFAGGIQFTWGLAGAAGAAFTLIKLPHHTRGQIEHAKRILRSDRDVVQLNTLHVKQWLELDIVSLLDRYLLVLDTVCAGLLCDRDNETGEPIIYTHAEALAEIAGMQHEWPDDFEWRILPAEQFPI